MANDNLKASDRCDRCNAAAMVRVGIAGFDLLLCAHDYRKNESALTTQGGVIMDDIREREGVLV